MIKMAWATDVSPLQAEHFKFLIGKIPYAEYGLGPCVSLGVYEEGALSGVVAFHNYDPARRILEMTGAATSKSWANRRVIGAMFQYPFVDAGCRVVVWRTSSHNKPVQRMAKALGFEMSRIPDLRGPGEDDIFCTLTKERWQSHKFMRWTHGVSETGPRSRAA